MAKSGNFYINIIAKSVLILMSCHPHFRAKLRPFITASDLAILAWVVSHFFFHGPVASFASTAPTFRLTPNSYAGCISCDPPPPTKILFHVPPSFHLIFILSISFIMLAISSSRILNIIFNIELCPYPTLIKPYCLPSELACKFTATMFFFLHWTVNRLI